MKKIGLFSLIFLILLDVKSEIRQRELYNLVNPFVGTGGHGHTFPGPTMPFGACQLSPDTRLEGWDGCSGYHHSDSLIYGFSHTHLSGTGCSDYGDILMMPVDKAVAIDNYQYASRFSHQREKAHAGYYEVWLDEPQIKVELTTTLHGGVHRYTFGAKKERYVVLNYKHRDELLDSYVEQVDEYTIRGYRYSKAWALEQKIFFEIKFSTAIESIEYDAPAAPSSTSAVALEKSPRCLIRLMDATEGSDTSVVVRCSISGVDMDGAHKNMMAEMPHSQFETYKTLCEESWNKELSKLMYNSDKAVNDTIFYTALYHTMIHPSLYSDVDGRYRGRDDKIYSTDGKFDYYTVFSLWDTYRALHPLLTMIDKKRTLDFVQTFLEQYKQVNRLPIWELSSNETNCMIGYHVVSVIWDAYNRGIRDFDIALAYEAMCSIATHYDHYEGEGLGLTLKQEYRSRAADADALESYCRYGYVRSDDSPESVSKTLEYAYDDWCIAQMALALGKQKDYEYYMQRSSNWKNVYDPVSGFARARKNGTLNSPFSPYTVDNNFTEANSWQYSFYMPHDVKGYIELLGGEANVFEKKLDELFAASTQTQGRTQSDITGLIGQYAHGNEPSHHIPFLYNFIGKKEKMQKLVEKICDSFYTNRPDGLIGNEDCGQMSAWYVMAKMGIYSTCPGEAVYDVVEAPLPVAQMMPIYKMDIDVSIVGDREIAQLYHDKEAKVSYPHPNKKYKAVSVNPFIKESLRFFDDTCMIELGSISEELPIYYSTDNGGQFKRYTSPLYLDTTTDLLFYSQQKKEDYKLQEARFVKIANDKKVVLYNNYTSYYHGGGAKGLVDGIYGKTNWRTGDWQGYQGQDIEVMIELEKPTLIKKLGANFLEDQNAWIFFPTEVSFYTSMDTTTWNLVEHIKTNKSGHNLDISIANFNTQLAKPQEARYIKMKAKHFGAMPEWHEGRGAPTYIFIDEIEVN